MAFLIFIGLSSVIYSQFLLNNALIDWSSGIIIAGYVFLAIAILAFLVWRSADFFTRKSRFREACHSAQEDKLVLRLPKKHLIRRIND